MREFSKVSPSVWRSKKFRAIKDHEAQRVYLYLLTCPHGSSIGCFDIDPNYAAADLEINSEQFRTCIETLSNALLIEFDWDDNTVLLVNWESYNEPANINHAKGMIAQFKQASSEMLKAKCFKAFLPIFISKGCDKDASFRKAWQPLFDQYRNGIATETETRDQRPEMETRPRLEETETEMRETAQSPRLAPEGRSLAIKGETQPSSALVQAAKRIGAVQ